jgi:hypothetical protein
MSAPYPHPRDSGSPARSIEAMKQHMNDVRQFEELLEKNGLQTSLGEILDELDMYIRLDRNHPDDGTEANIEDIDLPMVGGSGMDAIDKVIDRDLGITVTDADGSHAPPTEKDIQKVVEIQRPQWFRNENDFEKLAEGCEEMKEVHEMYYAGWREEDFRQVLGALQEWSREG